MKSPTPLSDAETQLKAKELALIAAALLRDGEDEIEAARRALRLLHAAEQAIAERRADADAYWETPEGQGRRTKLTEHFERRKRELGYE